MIIKPNNDIVNNINTEEYYAYRAGRLVPMMSPHASVSEYTVYDSVTAGSAGYQVSDQFIPTCKYVHDWVNSARINTSGTFTCTFNNSTYGNNFNGGYRLNLMDHTINITAGFGFNEANLPSGNSFNIIATGFPKPKFGTKVPIYYMRSNNYGAVALLYHDGSLGINRSGVSSPSNDYVFIEWTYIADDSYFS